MIVVADTSPFVGLLKIGHVDILPKLFTTVIIPPQVAVELASPDRPPLIQSFAQTLPPWLDIRTPSSIEIIPGIHDGELAAISLARELAADLLLIDDNDGRNAAIARNLRTARTAALLVQAATRGLLNLRTAFDKLRATNFRVPPKVLDELLKTHESRTGTNPSS